MLTITHFRLTHVGLISLVLVPGLCAAPAHAQCPDNIPASLVSSIQDPDLRAAAMKSPKVDPAFVAQNGGLATMIGQLRAQIEADRGWMSQETANQADLSRQDLGNDARARDGRRLMQTMREKQRLDEAYLRVLECHAMAGVSAANTPSQALVPQTERAPATTQGSTSLENAARQLEQVARATRDRALQNADPEVIAFYAKQDALAAQRDANVAAAMAGQARGERDGRNGALKGSGRDGDESREVLAAAARVRQSIDGFRRRARGSVCLPWAGWAGPLAPSVRARGHGPGLGRQQTTRARRGGRERRLRRQAPTRRLSRHERRCAARRP